MGDEHAQVRPNRVALTIVMSAGVVAGVAPFLLYTGTLYLAAVYFAYAAIFIGYRMRGFISNATERPGPLEWLLAGWSAVGVGATASALGFIWYGLSHLVVWTIGYAARALGWAFELGPMGIAQITSALFAGVFALAAPSVLADKVPSKLYPPIAGTRSAYFPLAATPWIVAAWAAAGVVAVAAGLLWLGLDVHGPWFTGLLTLLLVATGVPLTEVGEDKQPSAGGIDALKALGTLFSAAGYKLTEKPRTGSPEVDPLIASVDLLARAGGRGYAIEMKVVAAQEPDLEWLAASGVRRAAKALQRALRDGSDTPEVVIEPYLVVIGGRVSDDLRAFCSEEGVKLAHFSDIESLRRALDAGTTEALRVLQVPAGEPSLPPTPPSSSMAAAG